jgi:hypothetical protein
MKGSTTDHLTAARMMSSLTVSGPSRRRFRDAKFADGGITVELIPEDDLAENRSEIERDEQIARGGVSMIKPIGVVSVVSGRPPSKEVAKCNQPCIHSQFCVYLSLFEFSR